MSPTKTQAPVIEVVVGVANGGIAINWQKLELPKPDFVPFLHCVLRAGGFRLPQQVSFEKNKINHSGQPAVDYRRIRIPSDECQMNMVSPERAVLGIKDYLRSGEPEQNFGIRFQVA